MLALCTGIMNFSFAQSRGGNGPVTPVRVGSVILNLGVGVGSGYKESYSPFGTKVALEFGLWQAGPGVITLGGEVGASFSNRGRQRDEYTSRTVVVGVRSAWHYGWKVRGLDTYGGLSTGMGFHHHNYKNYTGDQDEVFPVVGAFLGASYFVTPRFGFNSEVGDDITSFQAGIVFKLK
ncbi:MAG: hypothetical protein ABIN67_11650 [Ferruginibacter sp.]